MTLSTAWDDMEDDLLGPEPDYDATPEPLPDLIEAERALRRIARIRRQRDSDTLVAEAQIAQFSAWLEQRTAQHDRAEGYHRELLERYHRAVLTLDPKAKTITLPSGELRARAQQPQWRFTEGVFLGWAVQHAPDVIRTKPAPAPELDVNAAKELLTRKDAKGRAIAWGVTGAGESPPGVEIDHRGDKFDITLTEDER